MGRLSAQVERSKTAGQALADGAPTNVVVELGMILRQQGEALYWLEPTPYRLVVVSTRKRAGFEIARPAICDAITLT